MPARKVGCCGLSAVAGGVWVCGGGWVCWAWPRNPRTATTTAAMLNGRSLRTIPNLRRNSAKRSLCHRLGAGPVLTSLSAFLELTVTTQSDQQALPLTRLSDDERLFRDSVYEFADREIRPLVREMD